MTAMVSLTHFRIVVNHTLPMHLIAKINKIKDLALILLISVFNL